MARMIDEGFTGNKSEKGGFYRRKSPGSTDRETLDFESFTYRDFDHEKPAMAVAAEEAGDFTLLLDDDSAHGEYAWEVLSRTLCYAAELVPDINESLVSVDDAMKLGYNWIQGPHEMIDTIGVDRLHRAAASREGAMSQHLSGQRPANPSTVRTMVRSNTCWPMAAIERCNVRQV